MKTYDIASMMANSETVTELINIVTNNMGVLPEEQLRLYKFCADILLNCIEENMVPVGGMTVIMEHAYELLEQDKEPESIIDFNNMGIKFIEPTGEETKLYREFYIRNDHFKMRKANGHDAMIGSGNCSGSGDYGSLPYHLMCLTTTINDQPLTLQAIFGMDIYTVSELTSYFIKINNL